MSEKTNDEDKVEEVEKQDKPKENKTGDSVGFPSAKLLLSITQKENDYEIDRKKTFETRSAVFVAFSGVLFTLLIKVLESDYFKNVQPTDFIPRAVVFGFFLFSSLLLLVSIYCFFYVIIAKKYARFDLDGFEEDSAIRDEDESAFHLMERYRDVVINNCKINDKKSVYFIVGVICIGVSALFTVLMTFTAFLL